MRLFELEIDEQKYTACCGLKALHLLQKKCTTLKEFEKRLLGKSDNEEDGREEPDVELVLDTAKMFIEEGSRAGKKEVDMDVVEEALNTTGNLYGVVAQLYSIYVQSMYAESGENEEKN